MGSGTNLVTTIIGFGLSATFIVFVCTRIICGRLRGRVGSRTIYEFELRTHDIERPEQHANDPEPAFVAAIPTFSFNQEAFSSIECTHFGRGDAPKISHMAFADDLILVAEASQNQVHCIKSILADFCRASGQKINYHKSHVFFSNNVEEDLGRSLSEELDIQITNDLGHYLGVPMLHQRVTKESYSFIIDRVRQKLTGWKAATLSFAGRVTLAQSCLLNIPGYVFQAALLPVSVCQEVEKLCRDFIWGSTSNARKCHLISWEKICSPKSEGGLGFKDLRLLNRAHMMKLAWSMLAQPDKLWVQVMKVKYSCGRHTIPAFNHKAISSNTWRAIVNAWNDVQSNITWVIRNGQQVRFWLDSWVPGITSLHSQLQHSVPPGEINFPVSHYARDGEWIWPRIMSTVPSHLCDKIAVLKPPLSDLPDFPCWNPTSDGNFNLSSAYEILHQSASVNAVNDPLFELVWKWQGTPRIRSFLWKLAHCKLMTNAERRHRGMTANAICPRCHLHPETILHCLRDCDDVKEGWNAIIHPDNWSKFFSLGIYGWVYWNLSDQHVGLNQQHWPSFFGAMVEALWKDRNTLVFSLDTKLGPSLLRQVQVQTQFMCTQLTNQRQSHIREHKRLVAIAWTPPPMGCYKVNVDGSFKSDNGSSACGGLIRDDRGKFIRGFYYRLGTCNATWAELWALRLGIRQARQMALSWVIFEVDSKVVVDMVSSGVTNITFLQPLLQDVISSLHLPDWRASVVHIFREANRCADFLANKGHSVSYNGVTIDIACPMLSLYLLNDVAGGSTPRLID